MQSAYESTARINIMSTGASTTSTGANTTSTGANTTSTGANTTPTGANTTSTGANTTCSCTKKHDPVGLSWLDNLLPSIVALSVFGGSITFSIIPSIDDEKKPANQTVSSHQVRKYLSLAWLFFTLALVLSTAAQYVLAFNRPVVRVGFWRIEDGDCPVLSEQEKKWCTPVNFMFCFVPMSLILQILVQLAFFFLALVVVAYVEVVGWVAVGFIGVSIGGTILVWIIQVCC
ncbi:hypothetical protein IQ07DRAFT_583869 [Pyrenochaeta sp. DS3sAY3a]|nr:hypothetical protein IQ07DRAFT_583869 [Pyrenochaeta sp. DS3sAY3a]